MTYNRHVVLVEGQGSAERSRLKLDGHLSTTIVRTVGRIFLWTATLIELRHSSSTACQ